jgi:hypothetical protein
MHTANRALIISLIVVSIAAAALTLWLLIAPSPLDVDGVHVSRTSLPLQGSCFDLTWESSAPAQIDGVPVEGAQTLCAWRDHTYTLTLDGADVSIPIRVVTASPLFWLIALTPIFCLTALAQITFRSVFSLTPNPSLTGEGLNTGHLSPPLRSERGAGGEVRFSEIALVVIAFAALVILLWLPFGINSNVNRDNWEQRGWFEAGVYPMFHAPISPQRPFTYVHEWIAYVISAETFAGYNLLLMGDLLLKGALTWLLLRRLLPGQPVIAWGAGLAFMLHPIDPFVMFGLNSQQAVVMTLIAANLLLWYWRRPSPLAFGIAQAAAISACAFYETVLPVVALLPVLLLIDTPRLSRRWLSVTALWLVLPALWLLYFVVWLTSSPSPYFTMTQGIPAGIGGTLRGIALIYVNALPSAYWDAARSLTRSFDSRLLYGLVAFVVAALIGWRVIRRADPLPLKRAAALIAIGLGAILAGMAMIIPSSLFTIYVESAAHPYYMATLGAALVVGALLAFVPRRVQFAAAALIAGVSAAYLINVHRGEQVNNADTARSLAAVVETIPSVEPGTTILLLDQSTGTALNLPLINASLEAGLHLLYETGDLRARLCSDPPEAAPLVYGCDFTPAGVDVQGYEIARDVAPFAFYRGERELLPYETLVIVLYDDDGLRLLTELPPEWDIETDAYRPLEHVDVNAPRPRRYDSMLLPHAPFFRDEL